MFRIAIKTVRSLHNVVSRPSELLQCFPTLEKPFQRAAARAAVEPNENLISRSRVFRWEKPEIKLGGIFLRRDGQKARVGLANIEIDFWDCTAIDGEF